MVGWKVPAMRSIADSIRLHYLHFPHSRRPADRGGREAVAEHRTGKAGLFRGGELPAIWPAGLEGRRCESLDPRQAARAEAGPDARVRKWSPPGTGSGRE